MRLSNLILTSSMFFECCPGIISSSCWNWIWIKLFLSTSLPLFNILNPHHRCFSKIYTLMLLQPRNPIHFIIFILSLNHCLDVITSIIMVYYASHVVTWERLNSICNRGTFWCFQISLLPHWSNFTFADVPLQITFKIHLTFRDRRKWCLALRVWLFFNFEVCKR